MTLVWKGGCLLAEPCESMLARAPGLADARCQRVSGGTFHSLGHSVLRKVPEAAGVGRNFIVLDGSDTEDLIDLLRLQMRLTRERNFPRKLIQLEENFHSTQPILDVANAIISAVKDGYAGKNIIVTQFSLLRAEEALGKNFIPKQVILSSRN